MASLTLKNIPPELLDRLKKRARQQRRSLAQELIVILEESVTERRQVHAQVEAWRHLAGGWESDQTVEEEIESILSARTSGREVAL